MQNSDHKQDYNNRIGWASSPNACSTIIEFIGGTLTNSTAITADALLDVKQRIVEKLKHFCLTHTTIEPEFPDESCRKHDG